MVELESGLKELNQSIMEFFSPGDSIELIMGVGKELTEAQVGAVEAYLNANGLSSTVEFGTTSMWPHALRLRFRRPSRTKGVAILPLAVLIIGALGVVGIGGIIGFQIGKVFESIGKNIVPITLIVVGGIALIAYLKSRQGAVT